MARPAIHNDGALVVAEIGQAFLYLVEGNVGCARVRACRELGRRAYVDHQRACLDLRPHRRCVGAASAARRNSGQKGKARTIAEIVLIGASSRFDGNGGTHAGVLPGPP